ncbi:aspergillopepsin A precursor [Lineolata rhizophorae]|uniref:Aspergillopepsin A n=1 Tax=Lineolata rhizophorae TaxID=578093 RepID=A0A6A6P506_9PEZI|nr:aspergillopepsin A precursor [Lineolata rhizophorae]
MQLHLLLLLALTAGFAAAAPAPGRTVIKPRSFKVPRTPNPQARRNGAAAIAKAYRKFGWGFIGPPHTAASSTNATDENGEVAAIPEDNEALFLSPVTIGGQTLNLDFDTGSSDLWVFSTALDRSDIGRHTAYDPDQSSTFRALDGEEFDISYGDGSGASGVVGTDVVDIGGATVTEQAVELATAVSQSFVEDANADGLVGLAFSAINTVEPTQQKTFFDNVMADLDQPLFTADLTEDDTGSYEFGVIDESKFRGDLSLIPVNASNGFWQFDSPAFSVGDQVVQNPDASPAIADTGTSLLLVDYMVAETYYSAVEGAQLSQQLGGFVYPCDTELPDFGVAIGPDYMAMVPGNQVTFAEAEAGVCFGGVQSNGGAGLQIFGDTMFKTQFVVFNGGDMTLGFAPKD